MQCPKCGHTMHKAGFCWSGGHKVQRFRCQKCGSTTTKPEAVKDKPEVIIEGGTRWLSQL
jgi:transcriptional regulator NrdR family protein